MRIVIFAAGSQGDIQPCLLLGRALQRESFEATLAAPQNFATQAQELRFHPLRGAVQQVMAGETGRQLMEKGGANPLQTLLAMRRMIGPLATQMAEDALEACQEAQALLALGVFAPFAATFAEIRRFQAEQGQGRESRFIDRFGLLPGWLRRLILGAILKSPRYLKELNGTVALTSVGMFGDGGGWGIPVSSHTLQLTLGGIAKRPALIEGRLENREYLSVTISLDHDSVDGAPAARFIQRLKELVESSEIAQDQALGKITHSESGGKENWQENSGFVKNDI